MTKQIFQVTGAGLFPLDMLRYDNCWPCGEEDIPKIDNDYTCGLQGQRTVTLCRIVRNKNLLPTADRWATFGWLFVPSTIKLYCFP